jgi:hypothetical protein
MKVEMVDLGSVNTLNNDYHTGYQDWLGISDPVSPAIGFKGLRKTSCW